MLDKEKKYNQAKIAIYIWGSVMLAFCFGAYLYATTSYPRGIDTDTFGHMFKANYLYESILKGDWYPNYTEYWYNGMEIFRYWPPLSYYVMAFLQFITGGNVLNAFYLFAGLSYLITMIGWFFFGNAEERFGMAFLVGNLYFFCPDIMRIFFAEGNIPRIFINALLPMTFYFVWKVIHYKEKKALIGLGIIMIAITMSHYMIAAMTGISIFIFAAIYGIMNREWKPLIWVTVDLVLAYMTTGIALLPGLTGGGIISQNSEASVATINQWAQEAVLSLNPFIRYSDSSQFYFGLSYFCIILLGIIAANRKNGAGFITALFIFLCTTTTVSTVVKLLPMSQVFWMQRFVPMAMCTFFISLLVWKKLKRSAIRVFSIVMLLDFIPTSRFMGDVQEYPIEVLLEEEMSQYLLEEAMMMTENRLGILDNSLWGSIPSYYLSKDMDDDSVQYSFGWAYQGARTMENIVSINEALGWGYYAYAFDRLLELGDDTVLVYKELIPEEKADNLQVAAEAVGYRLMDENDRVWLYHIDSPGTFGIIKHYDNLAIGEYAGVICYLYPQFGYGDSYVLEDYSYEELISYEKLYLAGFTYRDKEEAEALLKRVADAGVKIYIDMQSIPINRLHGKAEFMDVYAQYVAFTERFPVLSTDNGSQFKLDFKVAGYETWNTVYLSGLDESLKSSYYDSKTDLDYLGRKGHPNIYFMGFNTVYYYIESGMGELLTYLNEVFDEVPEQICESTLVPVQVIYEPERLTIISEADRVNAGVADLDCFVPAEGANKQSRNHLLYVDKGTTVFRVKYTGQLLGSIVSGLGIIGFIVFWGCMIRVKREDE
ncbi:MAG: hypothetical protein IJ327_02730 [Lachnospiraceae bacterium]|nr:hypothetical protein [Lachnospiraceae bacterium]